MFGMDAPDLVLLVIGGYLAVITLIRLMHRRRQVMIDNLSRDIEIEKQRLQEEREIEKQRQAREEMEQRQSERLQKRMRKREEQNAT